MAYTILIIDDDPQILTMLRMNFEDEGYRVLIGQDGQAAIQQARQYRPQLIIMDVNMPMYNGLKALEALRGLSETRLIPVILLTGAQSDTIYPSIEGVDRVTFVKKPVDLENINSLVRQIIEKTNRY